MLLMGILFGELIGGFFGFHAAYIGTTADHHASSPRGCGRTVAACPASRFLIALVTLICAVQSGLITGILLTELL